MSQTSDLLHTLKKCLKAKGMSYRQLAEKMGLSETSIKRLFSQESFSLKRIESVCKILDMDMFDLAMMAKKERGLDEEQISLDQERALASDPKLLTFFYLLILGWPVTLVTEKYDISQDEASKYLIRLDQIGLIELHPYNRVKLLVTKLVFWRKHGPIWEVYKSKIRDDYFESEFKFDTPNSRIEFNPGQLSNSSIKIMLSKIDALIRQFNELAEMDNNLPVKNRYSTALHIGFRPWEFSLFAELKKEKLRN